MQVTDRFDRIGGAKGFVAQYTVHLRGADEEFLGIFLYGLSDDFAHGRLLVQARRAARGNEDGMDVWIRAHGLESGALHRWVIDRLPRQVNRVVDRAILVQHIANLLGAGLVYGRKMQAVIRRQIGYEPDGTARKR